MRKKLVLVVVGLFLLIGSRARADEAAYNRAMQDLMTWMTTTPEVVGYFAGFVLSKTAMGYSEAQVNAATAQEGADLVERGMRRLSINDVYRRVKVLSYLLENSSIQVCAAASMGKSGRAGLLKSASYAKISQLFDVAKKAIVLEIRQDNEIGDDDGADELRTRIENLSDAEKLLMGVGIAAQSNAIRCATGRWALKSALTDKSGDAEAFLRYTSAQF